MILPGSPVGPGTPGGPAGPGGPGIATDVDPAVDLNSY